MTVKELSDRIESLRAAALFGDADDDHEGLQDRDLTPLAAQEALQALAFLEAAHRCARKAEIHQQKGD